MAYHHRPSQAQEGACVVRIIGRHTAVLQSEPLRHKKQARLRYRGVCWRNWTMLMVPLHALERERAAPELVPEREKVHALEAVVVGVGEGP